MANTVYGPYSSTSWVSGVTPGSQTNMNNLELQASIALHGLNPDLISDGVVLTGVQASGTAGTTIVNIASGRAYVVYTDGTYGLIVVGSTTQTTATINSTYHLYLQPDGTWYWSTSNSPAANSLHIADVTTNGSGQISTITDYRPQLVRLMNSASGISVVLPTNITAILGGALAAPSVAGTSASAVAGAGMGTGTYKYVVTYAMDGGETLQSASVSVTTTGGNNQVSLTGIPVSADPRVTRRKIYRTAVGGSTYSWVATIGDNTTTTYTDTASDAKIASTTKVPPTRATLGGNLRAGYPWSTSTPNSAYAGTVTGVTFGQAGMVTGDSGTAALFNGTTDKITFPTSGLPSGNQPWTLLCIAKPTNATNASNAVPIGFGNGGASGQAALLYQAAAGGWVAGTSSGDTAATGTSGAGVKHLLAATWDGTTLTMNVDGGAATNTATPGVRSLLATNGRIGDLNNGSEAFFFPGTVQKAAVFNYALSAQQIAFYNTLMGGASGNITFDQQIADDGAIRYYTLGDAVSATTATETTRYETNITTDGKMTPADFTPKQVGGQLTAGSFGVPVIIAQSTRNAITTTAQIPLLSCAIPANGTYRINWSLRTNNGSSAHPRLQANFTNSGGVADSENPLGQDGGGNAHVYDGIGGTILPTGNFSWPIVPSILDLNAGSLVLVYQTTGTPNDTVSVVVERLA